MNQILCKHLDPEPGTFLVWLSHMDAAGLCLLRCGFPRVLNVDVAAKYIVKMFERLPTDTLALLSNDFQMIESYMLDPLLV